MGNNHSSSIVTRNAGALDTFVSELGPDVMYDKRYANESYQVISPYKIEHEGALRVVSQTERSER